MTRRPSSPGRQDAATGRTLRARLAATLNVVSKALLRLEAKASLDVPFPRGHAALALAHDSLGRVFPERGHAEKREEELSRAGAALARGVVGPYLFGGFTGVAWVHEFFQCKREARSPIDPCSAIDEALETYLCVDEWDDTFDLVSGLVGYGVYALERMPRPTAVRILESVVRHLESTSTRTPSGATWWSRPEWLDESPGQTLEPAVDLGMAHGVPGVVALLARVHAAGVACPRAARLLESAVAWLLEQEAPAGMSAFPYGVFRDRRSGASRAAWCYGDPGIACAVLAAARATKNQQWYSAALRIGECAVARSTSDAGVADASICHGAGGLCTIFRRLFRETRKAYFADAALAWLEVTLDYCQSPRGDLKGRRSHRWVQSGDVSLLAGITGTAMVLADAYTGVESEWDRVLLLSAPELGADEPPGEAE